MKNRIKIISLILLLFLIGITLILTGSYSFFSNVNSEESSTAFKIDTCAKILFSDNNIITLDKSFPVSDNIGLTRVPYTFKISSNCEDVDYHLYLVTLEGNTLSDNSIKYALTYKNNKNILSSGILANQNDGARDFSAKDIKELRSGLNANYAKIYTIYSGILNKNNDIEYDLYLWISSSVTANATMQKNFSAGLVAKDVEK